MRRLLLLRHGRTPWNAEQRFQGQADISLAPEGELQAKAAAVALASFGPVVLWSSDLARARETATYVAEAGGLVPVLDPRLREVHVGAAQGMTHPEIVAAYGPEPWDYGRLGGEAEAALAARVSAAIGDLAAALAEGQTGIAVSHGHALRAGVGAFLGLPDCRALGSLGNCAWIELTRAHTTDRWRLAAYNRVAPDFVNTG